MGVGVDSVLAEKNRSGTIKKSRAETFTKVAQFQSLILRKSSGRGSKQ